MNIQKTAYGAGKKDFSIPNILRIFMGEMTEAVSCDSKQSITVIETNIDDTTPEIMGYVMEKLFEAGAREVFFSPIYIKKCRPATLIRVICDEAKISVMEHILFTETTTIGLRKYNVERTRLPRKAVIISTPYCEVKAKEAIYDNTCRTSIEHEDARRLTKEKNIPVQDIMRFSTVRNLSES